MRILIIFATLLIAGLAQAEDLTYRLLRNIEDTATGELNCIFLDRQGLLWMGSNNGLKSYDGYRTRTFRSDAYSSDVLPSNTVLSMTEDRQGNMWIGTRNGLVRMDRRTGEYRTYHLPQDNQRIIYTLFTSADGTVWIGTDGGLTKYLPGSDSFYTYPNKGRDLNGRLVQMGGISVKSIVEDRQGHLYVGTWESGLLRLDAGGNSFVQYPKRNEMNSAYSLFIDSAGRLWIGTWGFGLECMERPTAKQDQGWRSYSKPGGFSVVYKMVEDPLTHTLWACCREGVSVVDLKDPAKGTANYTQLTDQRTEHLSHSHDIATDGWGNIWIATTNEGVKHLNTGGRLFDFYEIGLHGTALAKSSVASVFTQDNNRFWLGLRPFGVVLFDRRTGRSLTGRGIPALRDIPERALQAAAPSIVRRQNGEIWIANSSFGIIVMPPGGGKAWMADSEHVPFVHDNYVNTLYAARDGRMWIGQRTGVGVANPDNTGRRLTMREGEDDFSNCDVKGISEDHKGNIWIATENKGIIKAVGNKFSHYCPRKGNLPVYEVTHCFEDSSHRLWAISNSGGLLRYEADGDRFVPVSRQYNIFFDRIYAINEDAKHNLWLAADNFVVRLSFRKGKERPDVVFYSQEDGLCNLSFEPNVSFRFGNDLYLGTKNGFYGYSSLKAQGEDRRRASLIVTNLFVGDTPYEQLQEPLRERVAAEMPGCARTVTLPAGAGKLSVEYALLTYANQELNRYHYWLEGYDSGWRQTEASLRRATYENLPPETYRLHLAATDSYGCRTEMPYTIEVRILPPWYRTWWAYALYLLLLAGALYGFICWYRRHLRMQNRLQMTNVLTNITHELLTPLTVISASVDELRANAPGHEASYAAMQNNISRLTRLLRQILEVRKSQEGRLRLEVRPTDLTTFVRSECENILPMAKSNGQQMELHLDEVTGYFDTDKIDKILYNLLSNAIKYNKEGGRIKVSLSQDGDQARLTVADNGIGISKEKMKHLYSRFLDGDYRRMNTLGTGLGLSLTHDLVQLHHGTIDCQSTEGEGTTFVVLLPASQSAYGDSEISSAEATDKNAGRQVMADTGERAANGPDQPEKDYTMLIVEDNTELLGLMERLLSRRYRVLTAREGRQALNIIQKQELDIVISDVMMPVMDGLELTRAIKESDDYAQLPVILLTAKTRDEDRTAGFETGADAYLSKPFRLADLQVMVDSIIRNRERIRRRFSSQTEFRVDEQHLSSPDERFVQRAYQCVKAHLDDYDREAFARDMNVSPSTLYNKLRALTGQSISAFIMSVRMKEACSIVRRNPAVRVGELAMDVGISTPKYFTKCFKEEFGMLPSEYIEDVKNGRLQTSAES